VHCFLAVHVLPRLLQVGKYYMVGDNLETDIMGANNAGDKWVSVLTQAGMYTG
jgi:ribonucleotide monophosphatase NagD (HAD superfamily)